MAGALRPYSTPVNVKPTDPLEPFIPEGFDLPSVAPNEVEVRAAQYVASSASMRSLPEEDLRRPEFAFVGRSNVGKSSLINLLCRQRALALVSKTPGEAPSSIGRSFRLPNTDVRGSARLHTDPRLQHGSQQAMADKRCPCSASPPMRCITAHAIHLSPMQAKRRPSITSS